MTRGEKTYCTDRARKAQKLVDSIEPLDEIIRVAKAMRRAKKTLANVPIHCATCANIGACENENCEYLIKTSVAVGVGRKLSLLYGDEVQEALPTINKILQKRITRGIEYLEKQVASLKASEAIGTGDTPTTIGGSRLPRHGLGLKSQDLPRNDDKAGDAKEATND